MGRHDLVADGEDAEDRLDRPCPAEQMPDRRFRTAHRSAAQIVAQHALDRGEFDRVGHGRGAVRVDVVDVARLHARLAQRHAHGEFGALAFGMRRGHVIGVSRQAVADDFGIYLRAAGLGVFVFFQNDDARTLAQHEAIAAPVVGAARLFGCFVHAHVERAGLRKAGHAEWIDG